MYGRRRRLGGGYGYPPASAWGSWAVVKSSREEVSNQVETRASAKRGAAAVRAAVKRYSNERRAFKLVLQPGGTLQAWVPGGRGPRCAAALRAPLVAAQTDDDEETTGDESSE